MIERTQFLKKRLATDQAEMESVFAQADDRWDTAVYADGAAWNVRQVAIHLAEAERGLFGQMKSIVETGAGTVPDDFDVDRYNKRSVEKKDVMTGPEAMAAQAANRADMMVWIDTLTDSDLEKMGRHPVIGIISIDMYIRVIARHQKDHTADVARALGLTAKTGAASA
ncbi:MAG: DinB family protein [Anaerolineae bacterium]